jgi:YVTN family beta-propeller protein
MKSLILAFFLLALLAPNNFSQIEIAVFDKIAGTWEAKYESDGNKIKENVDMDWVLNHNFFNIKTTKVYNNNHQKRYDEIDYLTLDNAGNITGWGIDYNGFNNIQNFKGVADSNKITLTGSSLLSDCTITFELTDKQLKQTREIHYKNGETQNTEVIYSNIKLDYAVYSLSATYKDMGEPGLGYICHISEYFVLVLDINTNKLVGKIDCDNGSDAICFSTDKKYGYITNFTSNDLTIFDKKTNANIANIDAGEHPTFLLPVKNKILISHQSGDGIWVLDCSNNEILKKFAEGTGPLYLIESENKIYQPQIFSPYLFVINPDRLEITKRISTGGRPMEMTMIQNKRYGYMVNYDYDEVTKIDTHTDSIIKHIKNVFHPRGIASSPDGKIIYVTDVVDGKVIVIDSGTDSITTTIEGFRMPVYISFTADGKTAYIVNQGASTISVINTLTNTIIETFNVGGNPISMLIDNG